MRERIGHDLMLLPAVTAVIRRDDRFLLCRRVDSPEWGLVGGGVEPGEDPRDAVLREVREELGVRADIHGLVGAYGGEELLVRYANDDIVSYVTTAFLCSIPDGSTPVFSDGELVETGWFTIGEVAAMRRDRGVDRILADVIDIIPTPAATSIVEKAVCYVIAEGHLLVFTHDDVDILVTGVQVPAGTVEEDETPAQAAARELLEETGLQGTVTQSLGTELYDLSPAREEVARRHFFQLKVVDADVRAVWRGGEDDPATGNSPGSWTCRWIPLTQAHVLAGGLGARLGATTR
jgi:8-oxo-dGTP pyrophosphatase MutT (NUDIX family)